MISKIKSVLNELTYGPGGTSTDSKVVEVGIASFFLLSGVGLLKFLSNSKVKLKAKADPDDLKQVAKEMTQKQPRSNK